MLAGSEANVSLPTEWRRARLRMEEQMLGQKHDERKRNDRQRKRQQTPVPVAFLRSDAEGGRQPPAHAPGKEDQKAEDTDQNGDAGQHVAQRQQNVPAGSKHSRDN